MLGLDEALRDVAKSVKELYASQYKINIDDPQFWHKLSIFMAMSDDGHSMDEEDANCCPYCGQEM